MSAGGRKYPYRALSQPKERKQVNTTQILLIILILMCAFIIGLLFRR